MTLTFFTESHKMTFVDGITHLVCNAWDLAPNRTYHVFFEIQNDANIEKQNVQCQITHSPFGIGLPGTITNLIQPAAVTVPPRGPPSDGVTSGNGLATVMFYYNTPPGGHSCLTATILPNGPSIQQNTQVATMPIGSIGVQSFLVFGGQNPETMHIDVNERLESGAAVPAAGSWHPKIKAPAGIGPAAATAPPVNLSLAANGFYSIELQVTPAGAPGTVHVFHITGTVNGKNVGEVDIRIKSTNLVVIQPDPFIYGGFQSPDILLFDANGQQVPIGAFGSATKLLPDTDYTIAARVHDGTLAPATNTVIRFWEFPNGLASFGTLIDLQTATIQPSGTTVYAAHPFHSAPAGHHKCAVVSLYNARAGTCPDAVTGSQVPWPSTNPGHSCSAWRNTDSLDVIIGKPFELTLAVNIAPDSPDPGPIKVDVITQHVPATWNKTEKVQAAIGEMEKNGPLPQIPVFLLPALRETLKAVDLALDVKLKGRLPKETLSALTAKPVKLGGTATVIPAKAFGITLLEHKEVPFTITGTVPRDVKAGDQVLVHAIAHYPKSDSGKARDIEFLEILNIIEE